MGMGPEQPRHGEDHLIKCHVDRLLDMGRWRFAVVEFNGLDLTDKGQFTSPDSEVSSRFSAFSRLYPDPNEAIILTI